MLSVLNYMNLIIGASFYALLWHLNQILLHWTVAFSWNIVKVSNKFFSLNSKICDGICEGIPSQNQNCDRNPSQFSVTNCDGHPPFRHKLWQKVTDSVTILWRTSPTPSQNTSPGAIPPLEIVTDFPSQFPSQIFLWRNKSVTISVTKFLWRSISVTNFPSQKIVTDFCP